MFGQTKVNTVNFTKGSGPAVNLSKIREAGHLDLAKRAEKAGLELSKRGLDGIRAQGVLLLDHSWSMENDYNNQSVQKLVERILGFTLQIDVDGTVPVVPFDRNILPTVNVKVDNYSGVVDREIYRRNNMGSTNLLGALKVVEKMVEDTEEPVYVGVATDGDPDPGQEGPIVKLLEKLSSYPVFFKFLALKPVAFLTYLDDNLKGKVDNVDAKPEVGSSLNLITCSDLEFAAAMADEWDTWFVAAQKAGILRSA